MLNDMHFICFSQNDRFLGKPAKRSDAKKRKVDSSRSSRSYLQWWDSKEDVEFACNERETRWATKKKTENKV